MTDADLFAPPAPDREFTRRHYPNPFYPGAATITLTHVATGLQRSFGVWADTTRGDAKRLAWVHVRLLREAAADTSPSAPWPKRVQLRFSRDRGLNGGRWTE